MQISYCVHYEFDKSASLKTKQLVFFMYKVFVAKYELGYGTH